MALLYTQEPPLVNNLQTHLIAGVMRRRFCRPGRCRKKPFLITVLILLTIYILYGILDNIYRTLSDGISTRWQREWSCQALHSRDKIITKLCSEYLNHDVGGNLCHDLCVTKKLTLTSCITHKNTTVVLTGEWRHKKVVLKRKASSTGYDEEDQSISDIIANSDKDPSKNPSDYLKRYLDFVYQRVLDEVHYKPLQEQLTPYDILTQLYHPHPLANFSFADMRSLWHLLYQEEFIKLQLLQDMKHIPRVYGFCGKFYAVERVKSLEDYLNVFFRKPKPWSERVHVAQELLDLAREFTKTSLGRLDHCDVQPGNFGVNEEGVVVSLDIDTVFTELQMREYMAQGNCSGNNDCTFFDCMSVCNKKSKLCTSTLLSNNLYNICRDLLVSIWAEPGILKRSPIYAANKLDPLLNECSEEPIHPWKAAKRYRIWKKLTDLLQEDLQK